MGNQSEASHNLLAYPILTDIALLIRHIGCQRGLAFTEAKTCKCTPTSVYQGEDIRVMFWNEEEAPLSNLNRCFLRGSECKRNQQPGCLECIINGHYAGIFCNRESVL